MNIDIRNISFSYKEGREVLSNTSFKLSSSDMTVLLGRNGAGKSTLFKIFLRMLEQKNGEIEIDGKNLKAFSNKELARVFSYIPQASFMEFQYTVMDTLLMAKASSLPLFSSPKEKEEEEAAQILEAFNIKHLAFRSMEKLSGGEKQLVLIARAMLQKAAFIILDEPTSNLDYGNQLMVLEKLRELNRKGVGIIYSTHNPELALTYSSRILTLNAGKISTYSSPEELIEADTLDRLYGRKLYIKKIFTGENERYVCAPM